MVREEFLRGTKDVLPEFRYIMAVSREEVVAFTVSENKTMTRVDRGGQKNGEEEERITKPCQPTVEGWMQKR